MASTKISPPQIRYTDTDLLIVAKPAGLPSQADRRGTPDLLQWIQQRHGPVHLPHRLDQPASGLLLLVRSPDLHAAVADAFLRRTVDRRYLAVLAGSADAWPSPARWTWPLDGQAADTTAAQAGAHHGLLAVLFRLGTGRQHQLRRHAALAGTPILGDRRHGGESASWAPRLVLHAGRLRLRHPRTGAPIEVEEPLPDDLRPLWTAAGGPDEVPWHALDG